jgi:hypothetical protein
MTKYFFFLQAYASRLPLKTLCDPSSISPLCFPSMILRRRYTFLSFPTLTHSEGFAHTTCARHSTTSQVLSPSDSAQLLQQQSSNLFLRIATLRLRLACARLARLRCQICTSENLEQKFPLSEPFCQRTPCGRFNCTPCRNPLVPDRETIETNSLFSQTSYQP